MLLCDCSLVTSSHLSHVAYLRSPTLFQEPGFGQRVVPASLFFGSHEQAPLVTNQNLSHVRPKAGDLFGNGPVTLETSNAVGHEFQKGTPEKWFVDIPNQNKSTRAPAVYSSAMIQGTPAVYSFLP